MDIISNIELIHGHRSRHVLLIYLHRDQIDCILTLKFLFLSAGSFGRIQAIVQLSAISDSGEFAYTSVFVTWDLLPRAPMGGGPLRILE